MFCILLLLLKHLSVHEVCFSVSELMKVPVNIFQLLIWKKKKFFHKRNQKQAPQGGFSLEM